ncbi:MAG: histidine kinase, partial [Bacteroidales bacterium]|nr:histidine kinase [Bacteroidales bacterium]
ILSACTSGSFLRNKAYWENRAIERRAELRQTYGEDLNEKDFRFFSDAFIKRLIRQYTIRALYVFVSVLAVSFIIPFVMQWYDTEKRIAKHEKEKLDSELKYLKNQINPHFLFNSLNSIYALASRKSELTTEAVLKLSSILRYVLYDSNTGIVSLGQEINHIEDYIALQKLRLTDKVNLSCTFEVSDKGKRIEPLLLIPLVENVFKYGVDNVNQSQIELLLKTEGENLIFSTKNTLVILSDESKERDSGIGIKNVERRLELTYRDSATLKHGVENNMYCVELKINLAKHEMFSS